MGKHAPVIASAAVGQLGGGGGPGVTTGGGGLAGGGGGGTACIHHSVKFFGGALLSHPPHAYVGLAKLGRTGYAPLAS